MKILSDFAQIVNQRKRESKQYEREAIFYLGLIMKSEYFRLVGRVLYSPVNEAIGVARILLPGDWLTLEDFAQILNQREIY